ncbi:hypothetical protein [Salinivibrio sp. VYel1]|uniref:hypothetical protein n=1 Tax=Salinivibrio sp. VYel1 TaxID=2490490 RepID=UPI00128BD8B9|nr:hypothetical protein [Salinivibrio sp. VYel1]MPX90421.1 hypothetical protein [Salinivibrio sp. VYel1]
MDSRCEFFLSCVNCGDAIHLTHDHLLTLKNGSALACECGVLLHTDDEKFDQAKAVINERQKAKYLIWSGVAMAVFLATVYQAYFWYTVITIVAGLWLISLDHSEIVEIFEIKTKLAPLNAAPSVTFSTFEDFKASNPKLKVGFNKAFNKCCICESFTKQTINEFPVCGVCSSTVHARS